MRLNRYLAACGLGSRRSSEQLVREGRVFVNGEPVSDLSTQVDPKDVVIVDGKRVRAAVSTTLILNKPAGFLTTREDELGERRETIYDLLPKHFHSLHYVGRLDKESEGLLILTNSGDLTEKLTHPRHGVEKEYLVALDRLFEPDHDRQRLLDGFPIEGGFARAASVEVEAPRVVALTLTQGIKRQIRYMFEALGYKVTRLQRVRIGGLVMPELRSGRWRVLSEPEIKRLLDSPRSRPPRDLKTAQTTQGPPTRRSRPPARRAALPSRRSMAQRVKR
jgi:23S rRNA pseudouridine2605 synthase